MNSDLRCLSAGLLILVVLGVAAALPMDLFESGGEEEFALEDKRIVDDSITTVDFPFEICSNTQVCKKAEESTFKCLCPNVLKCASAYGRKYDATCEYSVIGVVFSQPKQWGW